VGENDIGVKIAVKGDQVFEDLLARLREAACLKLGYDDIGLWHA